METNTAANTPHASTYKFIKAKVGMPRSEPFLKCSKEKETQFNDRLRSCDLDKHLGINAEFALQARRESTENFNPSLSVSYSMAVDTKRSSNNLVKVRLDCMEPLEVGLQETGPKQGITETESDDSESFFIEDMENSDSPNPKFKPFAGKKKSFHKTITNNSSKPNFTFTKHSGGSNSNRTSKSRGELTDSSHEQEGHRIDTAVDVEEILAENVHLTEYLRLKEEEAVTRLDKRVRYTRRFDTVKEGPNKNKYKAAKTEK